MPILGKEGIKKIHSFVDMMFDRLKARFLNRPFGSKIVRFGGRGLKIRPEYSLDGMYNAAVKAYGDLTPSSKLRNTLAEVAGTYIDAHREKTKAEVVQHIQAFLAENPNPSNSEIDTVLGGKVTEAMTSAVSRVKAVVASESTRARNAGSVEASTRIAAVAGVSEPVGFFVVTRDHLLCEECARLHLLPDGVTPRVWKVSELAHGYHKRGENRPCVSGLHPHCRCSWTLLLPGYGFDSAGQVVFVAPGHDELARQRGIG